MCVGLFAAVVGTTSPAFAVDIQNGEEIFTANCAGCHAGGENAVNPDKKLKKDELKKYGKYEIPKIVLQVTKGNSAMPAFGQKLAAEDIGYVAAYVRSQADKGWS